MKQNFEGKAISKLYIVINSYFLDHLVCILQKTGLYGLLLAMGNIYFYTKY